MEIVIVRIRLSNSNKSSKFQGPRSKALKYECTQNNAEGTDEGASTWHAEGQSGICLRRTRGRTGLAGRGGRACGGGWSLRNKSKKILDMKMIELVEMTSRMEMARHLQETTSRWQRQLCYGSSNWSGSLTSPVQGGLGP